jgi:23S rRNA pseudouridine1911/1915/1917 synthase
LDGLKFVPIYFPGDHVDRLDCDERIGQEQQEGLTVMLREYTVEEAHAGLRLDVYLAHIIPDIPSRTLIKKFIDAGQVTVNGKTAKPKDKVVVDDKVSLQLGAGDLSKKELQAQEIELDIFYEDKDIALINKPIGLAVHPAAGASRGTLANALMFHFQGLSDLNGPVRTGIVHRLDKETSGLIVVAKTNVAHARLARQFEKHTVGKRYVARVEGTVQFDQGVVDKPIGPHKKYHDQRQIAEEGKGKVATTLYEVLKRFSKSTLIALYPQTGRTHQLRVHMKYLGHPILGDDRYGRKETFGRLALHAQSISFIHPITKNFMEFSCPVPEEFLKE